MQVQDNRLSVRELQESDIEHLVRYWFEADSAFLAGMGADIAKLPTKEEWKKMLMDQLQSPLPEKKSYCIIWLLNDRPVGHSNVNKIIFGQEAYMHLHLWEPEVRKLGLGANFIKLTLPWFFRSLQLQTLYCEPYALNPAPNKTMAKTGFTFVKEYVTVPGFINFEQPVHLWQMKAEQFHQLQKREATPTL